MQNAVQKKQTPQDQLLRKDKKNKEMPPFFREKKPLKKFTLQTVFSQAFKKLSKTISISSQKVTTFLSGRFIQKVCIGEFLMCKF